jgi:two-component system chemotaxis response regulator CheB
MTIRIVVVDDSVTAAQHITSILESEHDMRVVRHFSNADNLLSWPDLETASIVLLDVWMPGTSGLKALRDVAARVPVIVVSEAREDSDLALETLGQGAAAFISKRTLAKELGALRLRELVRSTAMQGVALHTPLIVIVGSTGAPRALERLVPKLSELPAAIAIVQHLPMGGETAFARWVVGLGLTARPARQGDTLRRGSALIAPAGEHMLIAGRCVRLVAGSETDTHVPSADRTLSSAKSFGEKVMAIVLSGMGRDGAVGVADIIAAGGRCIVQEPDECAIASMPRAAMATSQRVRAYPVDILSRHVFEFVKRS